MAFTKTLILALFCLFSISNFVQVRALAVPQLCDSYTTLRCFCASAPHLEEAHRQHKATA